MTNLNLHQRIRAARSGFTLVEMVVVISIIVMLVGLTVGVSVILSRKSEERETESILKLLDLAMTEWETASERTLTFGDPTQPPTNAVYDFDEAYYVVTDEPKQAELISRVLSAVSRNADTKNILKQISGDYFVSEPDPPAGANATRLTVKDPWDNNLRVVFPGRLFRDGNEAAGVIRDNDGTIRTVAELRYGICVNRKICFLSMGSDSLAGDLQLDTAAAAVTQVEIDQTADNLYSYDLLRERP